MPPNITAADLERLKAEAREQGRKEGEQTTIVVTLKDEFERFTKEVREEIAILKNTITDLGGKLDLHIQEDETEERNKDKAQKRALFQLKRWELWLAIGIALAPWLLRAFGVKL